MQQEGLQNTERIVDPVGLSNNVWQHFGEHRRDAHQIIERETEEDEVHGLVEVLLQNDQSQQSHVAEDAEKINRNAQKKYGILSSGRDNEGVQS